MAAIAGVTVTWPTPTDALATVLVPPEPEQVREKLVPEDRGPVLWLPLPDLAPFQPPDAVQAMAFVELQLSCAEPPGATMVGVAAIVTSGATLTITLAVALVPLAPVQTSVNSVLTVRAPVLCVPLVVLVPLQPPLAVQDVVLDDVQFNSALAPPATELGVAVSAANGSTSTVTLTWVLVPSAPLQVSE
jgi:hypothetical protein